MKFDRYVYGPGVTPGSRILLAAPGQDVTEPKRLAQIDAALSGKEFVEETAAPDDSEAPENASESLESGVQISTGDDDGDGDESDDLSQLSRKELVEMCEAREIEVGRRDSKDVLIGKLAEAATTEGE